MEILNDELAQSLEGNRPIDLDLGCGGRPEPGYFGVDLRALPGVDLVADLNHPLSLLPTGSVGRIRARHVLEHVADLEGLMNELHRVLVAQGELLAIVPHAANPLAWSDPTHVRFFGLYTFAYFAPPDTQPFQRKVPCYRADRHFAIKHIAIGFNSRSPFMLALQRIVNSRVDRLEWYERHCTTLRWPYEIACNMRPLGDMSP